jgi:hypothetical protein
MHVTQPKNRVQEHSASLDIDLDVSELDPVATTDDSVFP